MWFLPKSKCGLYSLFFSSHLIDRKLQFRRELSMGEIQYIWADPSSAQQQVALSSVVQAMQKKEVLAIARWVSRDGMDPKMGVLLPVTGDNVHYLLWGQVSARSSSRYCLIT